MDYLHCRMGFRRSADRTIWPGEYCRDGVTLSVLGPYSEQLMRHLLTATPVPRENLSWKYETLVLEVRTFGPYVSQLHDLQIQFSSNGYRKFQLI